MNKETAVVFWQRGKKQIIALAFENIILYIEQHVAYTTLG